MARPALNNDALYAFKYYQDKYKLKPHQAAGIVGNLFQESTMNPMARNPGDGHDGSDSIGQGQWNGDRAKALKSFAAERGTDFTDRDTQLDFVMHEMQGPEKYSYDRLMSAQNEHDAAAAMIGYERPQGYSRANPTAGHGWDNRLGVAQELLGRTPEEIAAAAPSQVQARAQGPSLLAVDKPEAPVIETAKADKPLIDIPKILPDEIFGMDTAKTGKLLGGLGEMMGKNADSMNKQVAKGGRTQDAPVQLTGAVSGVTPMRGDGTDGMEPWELLQMMMKRGNRGGRLI
ncbi:phage tail tip lysozyme [Neorhizobium sp. T7_12]|uniref:phage tail tip lysozyme n=1 Tax=Neorhizobium sp. T7_12 TaxID=2093832 RepID=UPI00155EC1F6|nr:phage tail tip lysozyme [Neorhizobium sp. T7_12]